MPIVLDASASQCDVCLEKYEENAVTPVVLTCGHCLCRNCSQSIGSSCHLCRAWFNRERIIKLHIDYGGDKPEENPEELDPEMTEMETKLADLTGTHSLAHVRSETEHVRGWLSKQEVSKHNLLRSYCDLVMKLCILAESKLQYRERARTAEATLRSHMQENEVKIRALNAKVLDLEKDNELLRNNLDLDSNRANPLPLPPEPVNFLYKTPFSDEPETPSTQVPPSTTFKGKYKAIEMPGMPVPSNNTPQRSKSRTFGIGGGSSVKQRSDPDLHILDSAHNLRYETPVNSDSDRDRYVTRTTSSRGLFSRRSKPRSNSHSTPAVTPDTRHQQLYPDGHGYMSDAPASAPASSSTVARVRSRERALVPMVSSNNTPSTKERPLAPVPPAASSSRSHSHQSSRQLRPQTSGYFSSREQERSLPPAPPQHHRTRTNSGSGSHGGPLSDKEGAREHRDHRDHLVHAPHSHSRGTPHTGPIPFPSSSTYPQISPNENALQAPGGYHSRSNSRSRPPLSPSAYTVIPGTGHSSASQAAAAAATHSAPAHQYSFPSTEHSHSSHTPASQYRSRDRSSASPEPSRAVQHQYPQHQAIEGSMGRRLRRTSGNRTIGLWNAQDSD
ncbi:hypothetical protein SISNIDRAFT_459121 [Sistotremastrum niveocremeum HHB9708]|uniref:RING-type domain-containing protein n=2 Tax=Sistotremastraceae TaxID=3402574 RepID=A0A164PY00_9AGAM|nr:hypothetical protein SISNIDRAFT_459121 [Sistotremastrum niveocremeum HHB9708]KZT34037.1 hypothetical protein SISSUDRAFT_1053406 [Sistotremastrum suecicum HHB10207 ss-3]